MAEATTLEAPTDLLNEQAVPNSDAAAPDADAAEAEVRDFIASRKEGAKGGTEADAGKAGNDDPELTAAREAAARAASERAERETRERIEREDRERAEQNRARAEQQRFEQSYRERMAARLALSQELQELGLPKAEADRIAKREHDDFNSHHADGLKLHQPMAKREAVALMDAAINDAVESVLGADAVKFFGDEKSPKAYANVAEVFSSFKEIVTAGLLTEAEAEERETNAVLAFRRKLEKDGRIVGAKSGQQVNGAIPGASDLTYAQLLKMSPSQVEALPPGIVSAVVEAAS